MLEALRTRLAELYEQRETAIAEMGTITGVVEADETRSTLTPEEDVQFVELRGTVLALDDETAKLEVEIADLEKIEARTAAIAQRAPIQVNSGLTRSDPYEGEVREYTPQTELRGRVERSLELASGLNDEERAATLALVEQVDRGKDHGNRVARHMLITGRPEYRSAWGKIMAGNQLSLTPDEQRAVSEERAASLTGNAGGFAVPYTIDPTIIDTRTGSVNPMRDIATIKKITTNKWTGVSSAGVTASWDGEAGEVSDDGPTLAAPTIDAGKGQAFVPFSIEAGEDWANMEADVRTMFANAKDDLEAVAHFTGDGTDKPKGIVTALDGGASEVAPAVAETFSEADLYALETALPHRHQARANWAANKAFYQLCRQLANSDGPDLWVRLAAAMPGELIGYAAREASAMDAGFDASATADNFMAILGDFANYYIVDRIGMSVELVPHLFATGNNRPSGQRGLYAYWRTGGDVVNIDAFRMLNVATAA